MIKTTGVPRKAWRAWRTVAFGTLLLLSIVTNRVAGSSLIDGSIHAPAENLRGPRVRLSGALGQTTVFISNNGEPIGMTEAETFEVPFLVLYRNGRLASASERTLTVELSGIEIPSPGVTVTLMVSTMHGDPDPGPNHGRPIQVWRESRWLTADGDKTRFDTLVTFTRTFTDLVSTVNGPLATPTDYYGYRLIVKSPRGTSETLYDWQQDHAFLMENQWTASWRGVPGDDGGAPPGFVIHYCDMFPFRQDIRRPTTWIRRAQVTNFVRRALIPGLREVFRTETKDWGFRWYRDWTGYRSERDGELLSIALSDGKTWFHSRAPVRGHAGISINVNSGRTEYDRFVDGLVSTLYHELFHNLQRNIYQHQGGNGNIEGYERRFGYFSEGTAVMASSVGQPGIQFERQRSLRAYVSKVWAFLGDERFLSSKLNTSYRVMPASYAALYWRFLYEQCGDGRTGELDPGSGMQVIRGVLQSLYSKDVVDISSPVDLITALPVVMDHALAGQAAESCPFHSYRDSLVAFARVIYGLRIQDGRCREPGQPGGCGFYDPHELYPRPPVDGITYTGSRIIHSQAEQLYPAGLPNSYGIDFVEIDLDPIVHGQSLAVRIETDPDAAAELHVELGALQALAQDNWPTVVEAFEPMPPGRRDGHRSVTFQQIDTDRWNRLALIITRLDSAEDVDPHGAYTLVVEPGTDRQGLSHGNHVRARRQQYLLSFAPVKPCDILGSWSNQHQRPAKRSAWREKYSQEVLAENGIAPDPFLPMLRQMASFRNRVVHLYWKVGDRIVYQILQEDLGDFETYVGFILEHTQG